MEAVKLTTEQERLMKSLEESLQQYHDGDTEEADVPSEWKDYPLCWYQYCLDREGCVRNVGEDLMMDIQDLFYEFYDAIRDVVEEELKAGWQYSSGDGIAIYVSPSYGDRSAAILIAKSTVVYLVECKAWNFGGSTPVELAEWLEGDYKRIKANYEAILGEYGREEGDTDA